MHAYILFTGERDLVSINGRPMAGIVEERLRLSKRIKEIYTVIPGGQLKRYSPHVSNPIEVKAKKQA